MLCHFGFKPLQQGWCHCTIKSVARRLTARAAWCHPAGSVASMAWSASSEMLAVVVEQPRSSGAAAAAAGTHSSTGSAACGVAGGHATPTEHWVQVWQRSNWHWYLKREERIPLQLVRAPAHELHAILLAFLMATG